MASSPITSWQILGEKWKQWQISSSWALKSLWMVTAAMKSDGDCFLAGKQRQCFEKQKHHSADKGQDYGLPSGHIQLWELYYKEVRAPRTDAFKLWC